MTEWGGEWVARGPGVMFTFQLLPSLISFCTGTESKPSDSPLRRQDPSPLLGTTDQIRSDPLLTLASPQTPLP